MDPIPPTNTGYNDAFVLVDTEVSCDGTTDAIAEAIADVTERVVANGAVAVTIDAYTSEFTDVVVAKGAIADEIADVTELVEAKPDTAELTYAMVGRADTVEERAKGAIAVATDVLVAIPVVAVAIAAFTADVGSKPDTADAIAEVTDAVVAKGAIAVAIADV